MYNFSFFGGNPDLFCGGLENNMLGACQQLLTLKSVPEIKTRESFRMGFFSGMMFILYQNIAEFGEKQLYIFLELNMFMILLAIYTTALPHAHEHLNCCDHKLVNRSKSTHELKKKEKKKHFQSSVHRICLHTLLLPLDTLGNNLYAWSMWERQLTVYEIA